MHFHRHLFAPLACAAALAGLFALHCGSTETTCGDTLTCATAGDGGTDVVVPKDCDLTKSPKDSPSCVDDNVGIFVDSAGGVDSSGRGAKSAPVKTITYALSVAGGRPRIYICDGSYPEHVKLSKPISLFGGFQCNSWVAADTKPMVAPPDTGYALEVVNVTTPITISTLAFEAKAGDVSRPSSVAVFVNDSNVDFASVDATAGAGVMAADGKMGSNYDASVLASDPTRAGHDAAESDGGARQDCANLCANGKTSTGGKGGNGPPTPSNGEPGKPDHGGGQGGQAFACNVTAQNGGSAAVANDSAPAAVLGTLSAADGFVPSPGAAGVDGDPGQGGGGGGGSADLGKGGGGGGGCGGCGGAGGTQAGGGGASIAVAILNGAGVSFSGCKLKSAGAGDGGKGAGGQEGQAGGNGGTQTSGACPGGKGGSGGKGGASAGGAGGVSAGIVHSGTKPKMTDVQVQFGSAGKGGVGGAAGTNNGRAGEAGEVISL